jgi:excisionase family DNA binding protein
MVFQPSDRPSRRANETAQHERPLLSVEETADLLCEARSTLYRAVKAGTLPLPIVRIGGRIRIPRRAVERLLAGQPPLLPEYPSLGAIDMAPVYELLADRHHRQRRDSDFVKPN